MSETYKERCGECRQPVERPVPICNLCGLSCLLRKEEGSGMAEVGGLLNAEVWGGYESTPGNGSGALDDTTQYRFSLCEFCLDWLFEQFQVPVSTSDGCLETVAWRPAAERIDRDEWRKMKEPFFAEQRKRAEARARQQ